MTIHNDIDLDPSQRRSLCIRPSFGDTETDVITDEICRSVKNNGDAALRNYAKRFDRVDLDRFRVSAEEIGEARNSLSNELAEAVETAAANIRTFHRNQRSLSTRIETMPGVVCWREARPIDRVGLYVPAGTAPLPSTVLMLGIPAMLAGCSRIILCSPPRANGAIDASVLAAASIVGIEEIYNIGGAQAIAAMAYGTESIPKVDKIFGPGNRYVTAAKRRVSSDPSGAAIDMLAGPSELLILADETARPDFIAADLLSQAEHDPDSQVVLVTPDERLAERANDLLIEYSLNLSRLSIVDQSLATSFMLVVRSLDDAVRFSNEYAPEHLIINTRNPDKLVSSITCAGSVFLGSFAPVTAGDYASGTNHTLPTGGNARHSSGISVESFQRFITFQSISRDGLANLAPALTRLAETEGLQAHKKAVSIRTSSEVLP
jgi:histidinol dehydrogenase